MGSDEVGSLMTMVRWDSIPDQTKRYARYESHGYAYVSPEGIDKWNALADANDRIKKS